MKKFLSSLLALTMILSLVIVPARAANELTVTGLELSAKIGSGNDATDAPTTIASGTTVNFSITGTASVKEGETPVDVTSVTPTYSWSASSSAATLTKELTTTQASERVTVYCDVTYTTDGKSGTQRVSKTFTVTNAQKAFEAAAKKVTYNGRKYSVTDNSAKVYFFAGDTLDTSKLGIEVTGSAYSGAILTNKSGNTYTVKASSAENAPSVDITITSEKITPTVVIGDNLGSGVSPIVGHDYTLTATYTNSHLDNSASVQYSWTIDGQTTTSNRNTITWTPGTPGSHKVSCSVKEGDEVAANSGETPYTVVDEQYKAVSNNGGTSIKLVPGANTAPITMPSIENRNDPSEKYSNGSSAPNKVEWDSTKLTIKSGSAKNVVAIDGNTITGLKTGSTTVVATVVFRGAKYKVEYDVEVKALDVELKSIANGDYESYTDTEFARILASKIADVTDDDFKASDVTSVKLIDSDRYLTFTTDSSNGSETKNLYQDFRIKATKGYLGEQTFKVSVNDKYTVTLTVNVEGAGSTIKETVTGTSTSKEVTFTNSDYAYLYYSYSKPTYKDYFDGNKVSNFEGPVKEDKTVTVPASAFKDKSSVTLYVVGLDKYGVASTGTIEVSQKSYAIEYNVVAGETLSFDQKAFESFMNDYADDNIKTSKGDYFEFDYVKFDSLPNSTREGVLYEGKDKIKTSTEVENLDKVTFESVAKAKDTIKVPFTLYAKQYDKNDKVIDKKVSMTGEVVISVVKEDIVYEVGVNSAVKLGSDKFIDFLRDSDKSYKKADLDYVTFDVGKNSAITSYFNGTGALYRYYNGSTGINSTVSAKDEFYYNPKTSSKHYDLDDVTYVTSKFAKVGDIVYIPFTAYGTKSGQKAEGTLAIKVKQTMNFVDVRPGDYFYDSVQWAVNLDITKGTSATTFSPKQGCTRAQIVTFLWRAANSPAPRSSTNKFTDVYATTHADYMKAIIWATEQGITTGTGNGKFSPDATCTRAQIVTFLYRFKSNPAVYGSLNFSDVNKTEHAAFYNAILWAVNNKITTGYGNGIFDPNGTCNRGDAVTFLYRALA